MPLNVAALGPGDVLAGKFKILRKLGEGGMGAVFEVEHLITKHHRALKLLHAHVASSASVVQRFLREASAAGRIGDPHIAETFDAGTLDSGEPYLVMEFLRGKALSGLLDERGGKLPLGELLDLIGQACQGVAAAHAAGIVHRDLKPDNLFVVERDGQPFVKVLDFGISKFDHTLEAGQPITREGSMLGTPYYMSPEQFRGDAGLDERADIYSLGVILYECAAGKRPYDAPTLHELMYRIIEGKLVPLDELRPDLPRPLIDLILRALAADRELRPRSVKQLADELAALRLGAASTVAQGALPRPLAPAPPDPAAPLAPTIDASAQAMTSQPSTRTASSRAPGGLVAALSLALLLLTGLAHRLLSPAPAPLVPATADPSPPSSPVTPPSSPVALLPASASAPVPSPSSPAPVPSAPPPASQSKTPPPASSPRSKKAGLTTINPY